MSSAAPVVRMLLSVSIVEALKVASIELVEKTLWFAFVSFVCWSLVKHGLLFAIDAFYRTSFTVLTATWACMAGVVAVDKLVDLDD